MKNIFFTQFIFIFSFISITYAPRTHALTKIKDMTCEQLIETAKNKENTLVALAGIRATKKCKDYKYPLDTIVDIERKLFALELADLEPPQNTSDITADNLSIKDLQTKIRKEKDFYSKIELYKKLRSKQRTANKRSDAAKTISDMYNSAYAHWKKNKKDSKSQDILLESALQFARNLWSSNNASKAEEILASTTRNLKSQKNLIEIYFLHGRIKEEKNEYTSAIKFYDLVIEEFKDEFKKNPPQNLNFNLDKVMWVKAWLLYKNENWIDAEAAFKTLADSTVEMAEKARAHFFQARCLNKLGKNETAKSLLQLVTKEDIFSYYALLAHQELGQKVPAFKSLKHNNKFKHDSNLSFLSEKNRNIFNLLIKNDELDLAERAIMFMANDPEKSAHMGITLAEDGGRFLPLFAAFAKLTNDYKQDILVKYSHLIYPQVYKAEVNEMVEKTGLPKSLIYSIMKQESAFNENTRSHANAYGLMQVIPPLAKQLARKYKLDYKKPDDLYNPQINIKLGSFELFEQVKKQNNQYAFVAAAYNAGPNALARWLKTRWKPHFDVIDFIEEIPYDETRLYVKVIARNHLFYDRIETPDKELEFPEKFIKTSTTVSQN